MNGEQKCHKSDDRIDEFKQHQFGATEIKAMVRKYIKISSILSYIYWDSVKLLTIERIKGIGIDKIGHEMKILNQIIKLKQSEGKNWYIGWMLFHPCTFVQ